jgi:hypothetical protein
VGLSSDTHGSESRLAAYVEGLTAALGHADRMVPFRSYCVGLLLPGARKSVELMAARVAPERVQAAHQSLHHFVAKADWSDDAMLAAVRARVLPLIEQRGAIRGWMIDDTGVPKKGKHSVGVARQYCGQLGKQDNCQVAVTLSVANDHASLPLAHRLYPPQAWADDPDRRARAGVPEAVAFQTKPQIALAQIRAALAVGVPAAPVLADAGYGIDTDFRSNAEAEAFRDAHIAPGAQVHTDGTSAFHVFGEGGRTHVATVTGGKRPERERGSPFFNVNTLISNLSTALKATYKVFSPKHLPDYLGAFCWTTNHRRNMRGMIGALCCAAASASRLTRRTVYA